MMPDIKLDTFPSTKLEALAMLYVQSQDLSGLTPEELYDKYQEAYEKLKAYNRKKRSEQQSWIT